MSWVVNEVIRRHIGQRRYGATDWRRFCDDYGIEVDFVDFPPSLSAVLFGDTILLRVGMTPAETAWWVWHEIFHHFGTVGNREFWRSLVCGDLILSKMERQANDFAYTFPEWQPEDVPPVTEYAERDMRATA